MTDLRERRVGVVPMGQTSLRDACAVGPVEPGVEPALPAAAVEATVRASSPAGATRHSFVGHAR